MAKVWKDINEMLDTPSAKRKKVIVSAVLYKWYLKEDKHEELERVYTKSGKEILEQKCREMNRRDVNQWWYYSVVLERDVTDIDQ